MSMIWGCARSALLQCRLLLALYITGAYWFTASTSFAEAMTDKKRVLILCTGNSARSQMAEGLLKHLAGDRFEVQSAGTKPGSVRPEAIAVLKEIGIDISGNRSKHVDEFGQESFDYVLTVCDNAAENCPIYPGQANRIHQSFEDPASVQGTEEDRLSAFRRVRDQIRDYLLNFPPVRGQAH
jgi:arsenate reductase